MTEIKLVNGHLESGVPQFMDLEVGQYFQVISDYYDEDMHLYIKLPLVKRDVDENFKPVYYNCFNITKNKLDYISDETCCDLINSVEIHI